MPRAGRRGVHGAPQRDRPPQLQHALLANAQLPKAAATTCPCLRLLCPQCFARCGAGRPVCVDAKVDGKRREAFGAHGARARAPQGRGGWMDATHEISHRGEQDAKGKARRAGGAGPSARVAELQAIGSSIAVCVAFAKRYCPGVTGSFEAHLER